MKERAITASLRLQKILLIEEKFFSFFLKQLKYTFENLIHKNLKHFTSITFYIIKGCHILDIYDK